MPPYALQRSPTSLCKQARLCITLLAFYIYKQYIGSISKYCHSSRSTTCVTLARAAISFVVSLLLPLQYGTCSVPGTVLSQFTHFCVIKCRTEYRVVYSRHNCSRLSIFFCPLCENPTGAIMSNIVDLRLRL